MLRSQRPSRTRFASSTMRRLVAMTSANTVSAVVSVRTPGVLLVTVTSGDRALYTALYPSRFPIPSSDEFAAACGLSPAPVEELIGFHVAFGKILRINPLGSDSVNGRYGIPPSNPFVQANSGALGEIFALGFRASRLIPKLWLLLFIANSAGYFLGSAVNDYVGGRPGMLLWGILGGFFLGAGITALLYLLQKPQNTR